jgi:RNA polymerase sigma-70 factor (ECF subfamily)
MEKEEFGELVAAARAGDSRAVEELVRRYGPYLRRLARLRLQHSQLRRLLDSQDVCQSALANFFRRAAAGEFELQSPDDLGALLGRMAVNKIISRARHDRRHAGGLPEGWDTADSAPTPGEQAAGQDFLDRVGALLTPDEWQILQARVLEGRAWNEIAEQCGSTPDAVRIRLARALARVREQLPGDDFPTPH